MEIGNIKVELNHSLHRLKSQKGSLSPSDIIVNGALKILREIYIKNLSLDNSINKNEIAEVRQVLTKDIRRNAKNINYVIGIAKAYSKATGIIVMGLSQDDLDYVKEEIIKLVQHPQSEETITNYYLANHGFNPFNEI